MGTNFSSWAAGPLSDINTIKVLSSASIAAKEDPLFGLKENVILGKLIPAGTGYDAHVEQLAEIAAEEALAAAASGNGDEEPVAELEEGFQPEADVEEVEAAGD